MKTSRLAALVVGLGLCVLFISGNAYSDGSATDMKTKKMAAGMEKPMKSDMEKPMAAGMEKPMKSDMEKPMAAGMEKPMKSDMEKPMAAGMEKPMQDDAKKME